VQDYHQLEIWRRAMDYAVKIYEFSARLPSDERFNLASQFRRAAVSVPLNIAEGCGCSTNNEFARFLGYAYRSLKEVVTCIELTERLHPTIAHGAAEPLIDEGNQIARMTYSLMQRLESSPGESPRTRKPERRARNDEPGT
jgi:four helix bundle protein